MQAPELAHTESLWRLPTVKQVSGLGRSSIYARMKEGTFPAAIRVGSMAMWVSSEVLDWVDQQIERARTERATMK